MAIKNFPNAHMTVEFTEDATDAEMLSGDQLPTLMGKIKRDLKRLKENAGSTTDVSTIIPEDVISYTPTTIPVPKENLLKNWDFRNPMNTIGTEQYTYTYVANESDTAKLNNHITIDNWAIRGSAVKSATLTVKPGYCELAQSDASASYVPSASLHQKIDIPSSILNSACTYSFLVDAQDLPSFAITAGDKFSDPYMLKSQISTITGMQLISFTLTAWNSAVQYFDITMTGKPAVGILLHPVIKLYAAKFEASDVSTLAYQDADGEWVVNTGLPVGKSLNKLISLPKQVKLYHLIERDNVEFTDSPKDIYTDLATTQGTLAVLNYNGSTMSVNEGWCTQLFFSAHRGRTFSRNFDRSRAETTGNGWSPWIEIHISI